MAGSPRSPAKRRAGSESAMPLASSDFSLDLGRTPVGYEGRIPALSMQVKSSPTMTDDDPGGRVFFSSTGRSLEGEDEIVVLSVGVDIGSSTSPLVFFPIGVGGLPSPSFVF